MPQIPTCFHSFESDGPFRHCISCHKELLERVESYMVQKSFEGEECVFEFAVCSDCRDQLDSQISEQSREAIFDFFHDHANLEARMESMHSEITPEEHISTCLTCAHPKEKAKSYSYAAFFIGSTLLDLPFPVMICGKCEKQLNEQLSSETRKVIDDFVDTHFVGPPSNALDLPQIKKPLLL